MGPNPSFLWRETIFLLCGALCYSKRRACIVKVARECSESRSEANLLFASTRFRSPCKFAWRQDKPLFCMGESASERRLISLMCEGLRTQKRKGLGGNSEPLPQNPNQTSTVRSRPSIQAVEFGILHLKIYV
jgi:hypothetical protein